MKLHDLVVPQTINMDCSVEKSIGLTNNARLHISLGQEPLKKDYIFITITDCMGMLKADDLKKSLLIDEKPDFVILLGDNTKEDVRTSVNYFSDNYFGYGSVMSERMKIISTKSEKKPFFQEPWACAKILDLTNENLFFKGIAVSGADDENIAYKMLNCDILLQSSCPEWLTMPVLAEFKDSVKRSKLKLILHGSRKERRARYYSDFGVCVKSCYGIETTIISL